MIQVDAYSNEDGFIDIKVSGHADSRTCAAVSALMQSSILYMQVLAGDNPDKIKVNLKEEE